MKFAKKILYSNEFKKNPEAFYGGKILIDLQKVYLSDTTEEEDIREEYLCVFNFRKLGSEVTVDFLIKEKDMNIPAAFLTSLATDLREEFGSTIIDLRYNHRQVDEINYFSQDTVRQFMKRAESQKQNLKYSGGSE